MPTPGIAANAYAQISRIAGQTGGAGTGAGIADAVGNPGGKNFGDMLKDAVGSVVDTGRKSDAQMQSVAAGKANILDVVTAVSETEVAVDALVAVREEGRWIFLNNHSSILAEGDQMAKRYVPLNVLDHVGVRAFMQPSLQVQKGSGSYGG